MIPGGGRDSFLARCDWPSRSTAWDTLTRMLSPLIGAESAFRRASWHWKFAGYFGG
jgi:hypothetical protein